MNRYLALSLLLFIISASLQTSAQKNTADENMTRQVYKHHDDAFGKRDLEGVLSDYTEESILVTSEGTYKGIKELRGFFEEAFKLLPVDSIEGSLIKEVVIKDIVFSIWTVKTPKITLDYATETFFIQNGKIIRQTFAGRKVE